MKRSRNHIKDDDDDDDSVQYNGKSNRQIEYDHFRVPSNTTVDATASAAPSSSPLDNIDYADDNIVDNIAFAKR